MIQDGQLRQNAQNRSLHDNWDLSDPANEISVMCAAGGVGAVAGTVIGGGLGAALGWFASAAIGAALDMDDTKRSASCSSQ